MVEIPRRHDYSKLWKHFIDDEDVLNPSSGVAKAVIPGLDELMFCGVDEATGENILLEEHDLNEGITVSLQTLPIGQAQALLDALNHQLTDQFLDLDRPKRSFLEALTNLN